METGSNQASVSASEAADLTPAQIAQLISAKDTEIVHLRRQVAWFQRQIFGSKSERRVIADDPLQGSLGQDFSAIPEQPLPGKKSRVAAHQREAQPKVPYDAGDETLPFFDETKVPVKVIDVVNPEIAGMDPADYDIIGEKVSYRLAQLPGAYQVLKYVRQLVKLRASQTLSCPLAPVGVIDGCRADVSFLAGMTIDKFAFHLPLYRQHRRLQDAGFRLSRSWLTTLMQQVAALLTPIYEAQLESIRSSRVITMDETPIKAGTTGTGKMKSAYFWPVYGEHDEICFAYQPGRSGEDMKRALGVDLPQGSVLLTDGYDVYARYARRIGLTHAQCWAHTRRHFFDAQDVEPKRTSEALEMIGGLYKVEEAIRQGELTGYAKRHYRRSHAQPIAERFFAWVNKLFEAQGFLPSSPLTKALAYARERKEGLTAYLSDPDIPIDTNHIERALRVIPMGRKNWQFCWTELGATHVGIMQSLLVTCRLHDIDPYDYLVDVLQRVGQHPASKVAELTPRHWKEQFAAHPLRSDLHQSIA